MANSEADADLPKAGVDVITIDGPSGSGKGTVARAVARRLGWHLLDSGALYRIVGLIALRRGIALDATEALGDLSRALYIEFIDADPAADELTVHADGADVSHAIREEASGEAASRVAQIPAVRAGLHVLQQAQRRAPGLVADGRDMGTVVFPDAALKIFLSASVEERALRRYKQLIDKGLSASLRALTSNLQARDQRDVERAVSPLRPAADAIVIDSTEMSPDEVLDRVFAAIHARGLR